MIAKALSKYKSVFHLAVILGIAEVLSNSAKSNFNQKKIVGHKKQWWLRLQNIFIVRNDWNDEINLLKMFLNLTASLNEFRYCQ